MKLFFTFLDGILRINCGICGGGCCRAFAYVPLTKKEVNRIMGKYPDTGYIMTNEKPINKIQKDGDYAFRMAFAGGCIFMDKGYCRMQKEYGFDFKPSVCRLYPAMFHPTNSDTFIVTPTLGDSCIFFVKRGFKKKRTSSERRALKRDIMCRLKVYKPSKKQLKFAKIRWNGQRVKFEKKIFNLSLAYLDKRNYTEFALKQWQLSVKNLDLANLKVQVESKMLLWRKFLKLEESDLENKTITYELTALTSTLRVFIWKRSEKIAPLLLLALYVVMIAYGKTKPLEVKTYMSFLNQYALGLACLSENQETKIKLLKYTGKAQNEIKVPLDNISVAELAERLKLSVIERNGFLFMLSPRGQSSKKKKMAAKA